MGDNNWDNFTTMVWTMQQEKERRLINKLLTLHWSTLMDITNTRLLKEVWIVIRDICMHCLAYFRLKWMNIKLKYWKFVNGHNRNEMSVKDVLSENWIFY